MRDDELHPDPAQPVDDGASTPSADELERSAVPGTLRRAPRYRRFVLVGLLVGLGAALVVLLVGGVAGGAVPRGTVMPFVLATGALVGAVLGGLVAVAVDRRS